MLKISTQSHLDVHVKYLVFLLSDLSQNWNFVTNLVHAHEYGLKESVPGN
jgi:hypothetical protein